MGVGDWVVGVGGSAGLEDADVSRGGRAGQSRRRRMRWGGSAHGRAQVGSRQY